MTPAGPSRQNRQRPGRPETRYPRTQWFIYSKAPGIEDADGYFAWQAYGTETGY